MGLAPATRGWRVHLMKVELESSSDSPSGGRLRPEIVKLWANKGDFDGPVYAIFHLRLNRGI